MKRVMQLLGVTLVIAGCAGPNPYRTPVEDRSGGSAPSGPGSVQAVEPSPGVTVQPVEEVPVFRPQREDAEQVEEAVVPPTTPQSEALPQNAAVVALLDGAQVDTRSGDLRAAQNRLERALRIAPRDPQVYYQLADVQRRMGQFLQAEQVALKGVDVATGQAAALRRLWSLLALIRSDAGNPEGAKAAQREASRY
ncbi:tetratricopeptide repeat protein [Marinobacterium litorale]|uniref:tetratricopeptide repeat protein n=1 Tax=Marinobacterium litorale TaxID=404770 RepID=UPI0012EB3B5B|nr:tetratricopeptide repeat protein [Marinobacterium litorale]